jgi:hypothetical protein
MPKGIVGLPAQLAGFKRRFLKKPNGGASSAVHAPSESKMTAAPKAP